MSLSISQLLARVGDENISFQTAETSNVDAVMTTKGGKVTFTTGRDKVMALGANTETCWFIWMKKVDAIAAGKAKPSGVELIANERKRQIAAEGWSAVHDGQHAGGELADAAGCYAVIAAIEARGPLTADHSERITEGYDSALTWPWEPEDFKTQGGPIRNLVKAGALIAAEIDRLQRMETEASNG